MNTCSNRADCEPAQLCYYDLLDAETAESVPEDVREHVAGCADCQSDIDRLRTLLASAGKREDSGRRRRDAAMTELLSLHFGWVDKLAACSDTKPFLPSLVDPLLRIRIPTPITAHVDNCPACSKDLSALRDAALTHKQLCRLSRILAGDVDEDADSRQVRAAFPLVTEMIERPDSGISTRFAFSKPAEARPGELQTSRPIEVEVIDRRQAADSSRETVPPGGESSQRRQRILNLQRFMKPAIAAAAMILIGIALLFTTEPASAVDLDQIGTALEKMQSTFMAAFRPGSQRPERERWLSHTLNKCMVREGQKLTLWDLNENTKTVKSSPGAAAVAAPFEPSELEAERHRLNNPTGIMPYRNMSALPANAKWGPAPDEPLDAVSQGWTVYDLTWTDGAGTNASIMRKWRVCTDPVTNLPMMIQYFSKLPAEGEYTLRRQYILAYLQEDDMRAAIDAFFP